MSYIPKFFSPIDTFDQIKTCQSTTDNSLFYFDIQKEVDFVLKEGGKIAQLIQVCYDIDDFKTKERELSAVAKAGDELKCSDMIVITCDYENVEEYKGWKIKFVPLWKWLIDLKSLRLKTRLPFSLRFGKCIYLLRYKLGLKDMQIRAVITASGEVPESWI